MGVSGKVVNSALDIRSRNGEEKWVLGDTGRSLEVGAEIEVSVISLEMAVEHVCIWEKASWGKWRGKIIHFSGANTFLVPDPARY